MSVTLNLKHTFETRVVWSDELIQSVRLDLEQALLSLRKAQLDPTMYGSKQLANLRKGALLAEKAMSLSDEDLATFLIRESFKKGLQEEIKSALSELQITRMSPVQTSVVSLKKPTCQGCIETNCVLAERNTNAGCDGKRTGVREPGPRWTETV